jgi:hypothetical protein
VKDRVHFLGAVYRVEGKLTFLKKKIEKLFKKVQSRKGK